MVPVLFRSTLVFIAASCASTLPADTIRGWEVTPGFHADDARLPQLLEVASAARQEALDRLREEWKVTPGPLPIRWRWETGSIPAEQASSKRAPSRGEGPSDFELGRTYFHDGAVTVLLPARKFLARPETVAPVVQHECLHAVHASRAGSTRGYEAVPRWLREGIALFFSGEGEQRVSERIAYTVYGGREARSFLKGVDGGEVTRAEAYLAVSWLRDRLGRKRFLHLVRRVFAGESAVRALTDLCGAPFPTLRERMLAAAAEAVRERLPRHREERFRAVAGAARDAAGAVSTELEILLSEDATGPLAATLRYLLAREALRSLAGARAVRVATAHLEALRRAPGTLWRAEALVLLGQCYLKQGKRGAGRQALSEVCEIFGEDRAVSGPARRLLAATTP